MERKFTTEAVCLKISVDLSVSVMANAEDTSFMASADPSVSAKPKKTKRGSKKKRQKRNKNSDGGRDEQAEIPSSSNRPRAEDIQSGMSQLRMTCSDDEDPSVKKFHDGQKEIRSHLQFPTDKDSKALDRGDGVGFCTRRCGQEVGV